MIPILPRSPPHRTKALWVPRMCVQQVGGFASATKHAFRHAFAAGYALREHHGWRQARLIGRKRAGLVRVAKRYSGMGLWRGGSMRAKQAKTQLDRASAGPSVMRSWTGAGEVARGFGTRGCPEVREPRPASRGGIPRCANCPTRPKRGKRGRPPSVSSRCTDGALRSTSGA